jgi:hypothetical protein
LDEAKVRKEQLEMLKRDGNSVTYSWQKMPMTLKREYFTEEIAVELSGKYLTEKQAIKLYLLLLKVSKKHSIVNAVYLSNMIESIGKPKFLSVKRLQKMEQLKLHIQAKLKFLPTLPFFLRGKSTITKNNLLIVFTFLIISDLDIESFDVIKEDSLEGYFYFLALALIIIKAITKFRYYIENECI